MRITSQMLNQNMAKAGVDVKRKSLLDYLDDGGSKASLFNIGNAKTGSRVTTMQIKKYEELAKATDDIVKHAEKLASDKKDNLIAKAKEDGDRTELLKEASGLVDRVNDMLDAIKYASGTLNTFYRKSVNELSEENRDALAKIGISVEKDGVLKLDKDKFNKADISDIEKILGSDSAYIAKLAYTAEHIGDNAEANLKNTSGGYSAKGYLKAAQQNKYDYKS